MPEISLIQPKSTRQILHWDDAGEVSYWAEMFGVTSDELVDAVLDARPSAKDIAIHLRIVPTLP